MAAPVRPASVSTYGRDKWWFVPTFTDYTAPKLSELNAGGSLDVSCYLFDSTDKPTVENNRVTKNRRICDTAEYEQIGNAKFNGGNLQYAIDPQAAAGSNGKKALETLTPGSSGFLVRRLGIDVQTDPAVGNFVNVYPIQLGNSHIQPIGDGETEEASVTQPFAITGPPTQNVALVS
jgi:hypothetical protein